MDEKRNELRIKKRIPVEYVAKGGFGSGVIVRTNTTDISVTGMRLGLSRRLPVSQTTIECRLHFDNATLRVEAEIVWREGTLMGVRFLNPDESLRLAIVVSKGTRITGRLRPPRNPSPLAPKPESREFDDLAEKWSSRTRRFEDPHEKWINRRGF